MFEEHNAHLTRRALLAAAAVGTSQALAGLSAEARPATAPIIPAVRRLDEATPSPYPPNGLDLVQVSTGHGLDHLQPTVVVDPKDSRRLLAASRFGSPKRAPGVAAFASSDGGQTWHETSPLPLPDRISAANDASVAIDGAGIGYVAALATSDPAATRGEVIVWRTNDGGRSFGPPTVAVAAGVSPHPWLAADRAASGRLWLVWAMTADPVFAESADGGATFDQPRTIATAAGGAVATPVIAAGPAGALHIAYGAAAPASSRATPVAAEVADLIPISLVVASSADGGAHFGPPVTVGAMAQAAAPAPGFRMPTGPAIAVDPNDGGVYLAYATFDLETGQSEIFVSSSGRDGQSFGQPSTVTGDARLNQTVYVQPQIAVDSEGGVAVTYFAVDGSQPELFYDVYLARSTDRGKSFGPRARISNQARRLAVEGADENGLYHWLGGAYQGLAAADGTLHPMWTDVEQGILTTAIPIAWTPPANGTPTAA